MPLVGWAILVQPSKRTPSVTRSVLAKSPLPTSFPSRGSSLRTPGREIFLCKGFTQATPTNPFTSIVDSQDPAHYIDSYAAHAHRRISLHNGGRRSLAVVSFMECQTTGTK